MSLAWIKDKVIWITGAASGLGAATAARLHQGGARLVLSDVGATPMVAQGEALSAFRCLRAAMPPPMRRDLGLDEAAGMLARGIAERRDRVYVPGWIRVLRWLRTPLHTRGAERDMRRAMPQIEAAFAADIQQLGVAGSSQGVASR